MRTKIFYLLALVAIALAMSVVSVPGVQAATLNVDSSDSNCSDTVGNPYCTIQAAVNAASPGDTISVAAGTYSQAVTVNDESLTLLGANAGADPNTAARSAETIVENAKLTLSASGATSITVDGFKFLNTTVGASNQTAVGIQGTGSYAVVNSVFERDGSGGSSIRGVEISPSAAGNVSIANNLFTGNPAAIFSNTSWQSAIWSNGGGIAIAVQNNVFNINRTAINFDNFDANVTLTGNTFTANGTHLAFGGSTPTNGSFTIAGNEFGLVGTVFNLSNVANTFRLDATANLYAGKAPTAMTSSELFTLEDTVWHKGKSGRNGFVRILAGHVFVTTNGGTIQQAITVADAGDTIRIAAGSYNQNITVNKQLTLLGVGAGTDSSIHTIIEGATPAILSNRGIQLTSDVSGITIEDLRVQNYNGSNGGGIYGTRNDNLLIQNVHVHNNGVSGAATGGILINGPVNEVTIDNVRATNNRSRGIVIWNGFKQNITITNSFAEGNNCCGIELQDGTASGVTITGNTVQNNADNGIGVVGLKAGAGPNIIANNIVRDNGRFGIEVKLPEGTGMETGDGSIVVSNNTVERTFVPTDPRDLAGIAVFRRGLVVSEANADIPNGVVVKDNTVSGYRQTSASDGFCIVVEGNNMTVRNNDVSDCDVGIQMQAGHEPYSPGTNIDGDQNNVADLYFGRGNSPVANGVINYNNVTGNTDGIRNVGVAGDIDGTCNWWGAADGPSGVGPGSGDSVSANVDFLPWLVASAPGGACAGGLDNQGPITSNVVASPNPVAINTSVMLTANVNDSTTGNSNVASAEYSLDGGTTWSSTSMAASDGSFDSPAEDVTATIGPFTEPDVYEVCVRGTDEVGNTGDPECILLAVYDPSAGFVTGGGWIWSEPGAYMPDPLIEGKATFGFVSRYQKGKSIPTGNTEFQFKAGDLNFHSSEYEWLVVNKNDSRAQYKGTGTVNGVGGYHFMLWATDGSPDTFRIKIWSEDNGIEQVVYDNGYQGSGYENGQPIGAGNIVIHAK